MYIRPFFTQTSRAGDDDTFDKALPPVQRGGPIVYQELALCFLLLHEHHTASVLASMIGLGFITAFVSLSMETEKKDSIQRNIHNYLHPSLRTFLRNFLAFCSILVRSGILLRRGVERASLYSYRLIACFWQDWGFLSFFLFFSCLWGVCNGH